MVQLYKNNPYLIDKKKFDFRIYVLVTQVTPELQVFLFKEGLARFATEEYNPKGVMQVGAPLDTSKLKPGQEPPVDPGLFMHLTNYAINKESDKFQENEADFKKKLSHVLEMIAEQEENASIVSELWS